MGAYLSEPNTQKESQDDSTDQISYGASSMQGWRLEQEDAHTSLLNFDARTRSSLFAVYDGHGGSEVAKYCAKYLPEYLQSHLDEFRDGGDLKAALKHLFLALDERLKSEEAQRELKEMRDKSEKGDDADTTAIQNDEDLSQNGSDEEGAGNGEEKKSETELLYDEATMPLEQVLMRYRKCETRVKKVLEKNKPKHSSEEEKENHKHEATNNEGKKSSEVVDFQKQEEIDIDEIKKNSKSDSSESNNNSNHEQDYDEASNLGDITESQQKNNKSANDNSKSNSESKQKLNKEELKLSPITKKSSFSSNDEDAESNNKPTSTSRDNSNESSNEESTHNQEKEHKTPRASSSSSGIDVEVETSEEASVSVKKSSASSNSRNNALLAKKLQLPLRNVSHKSQNLIAKFIADCVNTKLKAANKLISNKPGAAVAAASSHRNKKKNKKAESDEKEEGKNGVKEGEEEEADEEASGGDSEEEEEEDEEDEDDEEDSSEDEDEEFEDEDDDEDEEEDDEEEDEDEEDDEEEDDEEDEDYEIEKVEYDMEMQGEGVLAGQPRPGYDSGCTAVVALLVDQKHLYVANAGDSRCVVCRDGKAVDMSEDHKPEDEIERTRIERAGGTISKDGRVNNGLNLSRAIGDHSYKLNEGLPLSEQMITSMPDVKYLELDSQRDKFMVLACDGIWNFMSSQEVCDYVSERLNANYSKLSQICEELFMHCLAPNSDGDGTGCDNMTCIIVTFNPFRQASAQIPPAQAVAAGLKRSHENNNNGKENGGGDAASNKPHDPVDVVKSESGKETASQNNNEDEASNISKKLKQEHDGRDLGHVISERAS